MRWLELFREFLILAGWFVIILELVSVNKTEGSCNATETFIINPSGNYREDFELSSTTTLEEPYTCHRY